MKWARIVDNVAIEVIDQDPADVFLPDIAELFSSVPDAVQTNWVLTGETWGAPVFEPGEEETPPEPTAPVKRTVVSPVEYFSLFSPLEEFAIRSAAEGTTDPAKILAIFLRRLDHPSLTQVDLASAQVQQGLGLLVQMGLITAERKAEIEQGI